MADTLAQPTMSRGIKRSHDGLPVASIASDLSPQATINTSTREPSPAPSSTGSALSELTSAPPQPETLHFSSAPTGGVTPAKKQNRAFAEKEVEKAIQKIIKEEKAKVQAEKKAQQDEEKRRKAEEKDAAKRLKEVEHAQKDAKKAQKAAEDIQKKRAAEDSKAEKAAEKAQKDAKAEQKKHAAAEAKAAKAADKARQEAEKLKKERSQMRLGAFFGKPALASTPPTTPDNISVGASSRRSSIVSIDMEMPEEATLNGSRPNFDSWILPFFVSENVELAPVNRFLPAYRPASCPPTWLGQTDMVTTTLSKSFCRPRKASSRPQIPVRDVMALTTGSANSPVDLTSGFPEAQNALHHARLKILQFKEDVRPPYQGTYTRVVSPRTSRKLSRLPTYRGLPDTDYDYDSEAEWQEPEADDEDLEDEENLSEEEDDAEEMEDFLDDEADIGKRAISTSDVEPVSSGLCWEGEAGLVAANLNLADYRMQTMHDDQALPIDPYSSKHWTGPTKVEKRAAEVVLAASMQPPRLPLSNVSVNASPIKSFLAKDVKQIETVTATVTSVKTRPANPDKPIKLIPVALLPAFKKAIEGSDLNKVAMVEILKKQFPQCSKPVIKDTLNAVARREGPKEADKRWVLID